MNNELIIKISATAKDFKTALDKVKKDTEEFQAQLATAAKLSGVAFAALAGTIGATVLAANNFEKTFSNVITQLDKTSFSSKTLEAGIADLKKGVIDLGIRSGQSFETLNTGLFDIVSAGIPAEEALTVLTAATDLAIAGATDTASAVKAMVAAYTSYGDAAGNATQVAEAFFTASKFGVTDVQGLATEFNKIAGLSRTLGISFDEALASATALTNNGAMPVRQAFTAFEATLNSVILAQGRLGGESREVQKALSLENVQRVGINQALRETVSAYGGNVAALQKLLGSSNSLAAVLSLTGAQAKDVDKIFGALSDTTGRTAAFQEALKNKQETLNIATEKFKRSFEAAAITLGEKFVPLIIKTADTLGGLAEKVANMSPLQAKFLAFFLGFGALVTGFITSAALAASAFINIRNAILALNIVFGAGRVAAVAFWGAATLGVSVLIATLPTIISHMSDLVGWFKSLGQTPKGLEAVNAELERMKDLRDKVANGSDVNFGGKKDEQLAKIDEKIQALERLKQKELEVKAAADVKTASQEPQGKESGDSPEANKTKIKDEETKKRIALAEIERDRLSAINDEVGQAEIDFEKKRGEIKLATYEAQKILDADERALALENIATQNEALIAAEFEYQTKRAEVVAIAREQQAALDEELAALSAEEKSALREKDLQELSSQIMTEEQIENEAARKKLEKHVTARNQYLKDEHRFGTAYAELQSLLNSEQLSMASQAASALIGMQQSKNNTLKTIGKAAGLTQLGIDTATTAMSAYSAMAKIPVVGPALGAAAAAAVIAYGAERASNILAANEGGIVPNIGGSVRGVDSVPASLTPGELVVPAKNFDEVVESVSASRGGSGGGGMGNTFIIEGDFYGEESFIDKLAEKLYDAQLSRNVALVP